MKRVLIVSAVFPPEPVVSARLSLDIAQKLQEKYDVTVICPFPSRPAGILYKKDFKRTFKGKVIYTESYLCPESNVIGRFRESYSFGASVASFIRTHKDEFDLVYANAWPLLSQWKIVKSCQSNKIPCLIHVMDVYPESLSGKMNGIFALLMDKIFVPLDIKILRSATGVFAISNQMKNYLATTRKIKTDKITVIRNWQDESQFQYISPVLEKDNFVFMFLGSISPSANVPLIIESFLESKLSNAELIIAGSGSDKVKCEELVKLSGMKNIKFCSVLPEEVPALQAKADILLLSLKKGVSATATPSKLTSYLFSAKPVLACVEDESDVADIIREGACGFVVSPDDQYLLSRQMQIAAEMKESELVEMGLNGRKYALSQFSKNMNLNKLVSVIEKQLND
jgi:glycosyltransferase involved in cell wall biosynthesis